VRRTLFVCGLVALAGCGSSEKLPAICTGGPAPVRKALAAAPAAVRMDGVAISHCFTRNASADDVQVVGESLLAVAQDLAVRAQSASEGPDALQLGYLIGAARRGAARSGVASELVRRLGEETGDLPARSAAYERGLRAGLAKG
jgi:hypothetical protein